MKQRMLASALALAAIGGCGKPSGDGGGGAASATSALVFYDPAVAGSQGESQFRDYEQLAGVYRRRARSVAAIVPVGRMQIGQPTTRLAGQTLEEHVRQAVPSAYVCSADYPDDPIPGKCSAVVIGPRTFATAAHCVEVHGSPGQIDPAFCQQNRFVFDFMRGNGSATPTDVPTESVYSCSDASAIEIIAPLGAGDLALVTVSRDLVGRLPIPRAATPPATGDAVFLLSYPSGMPLKGSMGKVEQSSTTELRHTASSTGGSSGGALLNSAGELVGIQSRAATPPPAGTQPVLGQYYPQTDARLAVTRALRQVPFITECWGTQRCPTTGCNSPSPYNIAVNASSYPQLVIERSLLCPDTGTWPKAGQTSIASRALDALPGQPATLPWQFARRDERLVIAYTSDAPGVTARLMRRIAGQPDAEIAQIQPRTTHEWFVTEDGWYQVAFEVTSQAKIRATSDVMVGRYTDAGGQGQNYCGSADTCFGAVGPNCEGVAVASPCDVLPSGDLRCWTSVGAQSHDSCCARTYDARAGQHVGASCAAGLLGGVCQNELTHAVNDTLAVDGRQWPLVLDPTEVRYSRRSLSLYVPLDDGRQSDPTSAAYLAPNGQTLWEHDALTQLDGSWCASRTSHRTALSLPDARVCGPCPAPAVADAEGRCCEPPKVVSSSGQCVQCTPPTVYDPATGQCIVKIGICSIPGQVFNSQTGQCECPPGEVVRRGECGPPEFQVTFDIVMNCTWSGPSHDTGTVIMDTCPTGLTIAPSTYCHVYNLTHSNWLGSRESFCHHPGYCTTSLHSVSCQAVP